MAENQSEKPLVGVMAPDSELVDATFALNPVTGEIEKYTAPRKPAKEVRIMIDEPQPSIGARFKGALRRVFGR